MSGGNLHSLSHNQRGHACKGSGNASRLQQRCCRLPQRHCHPRQAHLLPPLCCSVRAVWAVCRGGHGQLVVDAASYPVSLAWSTRPRVPAMRDNTPPRPRPAPPSPSRRLSRAHLYRAVPVVALLAHLRLLDTRRPEKDHALQLRAMACVGRSVGAWRLHVVGSVRDDKDQARVEALRKLAVELGIEREVEFHVNATFSTMLDLLRRCVLGLHTMWNEHFGISVVEFMAAGVVPIAHNSAGPKEDIVMAGTGYLATTPEEYAKAVKDFASLPDAQAQKMREISRKAALRFSEKQFKDAFLAALTPLVG
mmetsp:Transcript_29946/g.70437  ORF Transcript_29946/g.70437 Transcript_29946/m.70437 type:complete len:308 (-) Transcript_29946:29-952(-)